MIDNLLFFSPLILIFFGLLSLLLKDRAMIIALLGTVLAIFAVCQSYYTQGSSSYVFGNFAANIGIEFIADNYSKIFLLFLTLPLLLVLLASKNHIAHNQTYGLLMLASAGFVGMALSFDLFNIYVFMEITSLSSYALVALSEKKDSSYRAFNYLIIGTIGATLYLLGVGFLYSKTGSLNLIDVKSILANKAADNIELLGYGLIIIGLLIKVGIVPCHYWLPKIYRNVNHYLAAFFSIVSANSMFFVLIKLFRSCFIIEHLNSNFSYFFSFLAIISILYGSIYACFKQDIKEILAYSSITNYGFILLAIFSGDNHSLIIAFIMIMGHGVAKAGAFLSIKSENKIYLGLFLMSLIGVPPLIGFYAKWSLIKALWISSPIKIIVVLISSIASLYYSLKIIENVSVQQEKQMDKLIKIARWSMLFILLMMSINIRHIITFLLGANYVAI